MVKEETSSSSSSTGESGSSSSSSSSSSSQSGSPPPKRSSLPPRREASLKRGPQKAAVPTRRDRNRSRSPEQAKRRRLSPPRGQRASSPPHRRERAGSPGRRRGRSPPERHHQRGDRSPPPRRREDPRHRQNGHPDRDRHGREPERPRDGRSRFDEKPPPSADDEDGRPQGGGREADGKPPRGRENRWEGSDAELPLPGPPPPPRREDRDWNHQSREQALPPDEPKQAPAEVEPNFGLSGKLAEESNTVRGVVMLHNEPPEARKPSLRWRLYTFKNGEPFGEPLYIHRQSCYLFGRERRVADVPTDHPSCSKQHAVLQYRNTEKEGPDGMMAAAVRPYLMDLGSTNGSFLNGERLDPQRYYELYEKDLLKFGNSSREYVLLHEKSSEAD